VPHEFWSKTSATAHCHNSSPRQIEKKSWKETGKKSKSCLVFHFLRAQQEESAITVVNFPNREGEISGFFEALIKNWWRRRIMEVVNVFEEKDYALLKDLRVELKVAVQDANGVFLFVSGFTSPKLVFLCLLQFFTRFCNYRPFSTSSAQTSTRALKNFLFWVCFVFLLEFLASVWEIFHIPFSLLLAVCFLFGFFLS
jgi:hypothetical protein